MSFEREQYSNIEWCVTMAGATYLVTAVLMGALLFATVVAVVVGRDWRQYAPRLRPAPAGGTAAGARRLPGEATLDGIAHSPTAWVVGFLVLALGFGVGAVLAVGGADSGLPQLAWSTLGLLFLPLLVAYLVLGTYISGVHRGHPSARAAGEAALAFGLLLVAAVVTVLLTSG